MHICIKWPDDKTIVFCWSLQIHNYDKKYMLDFCKRIQTLIFEILTPNCSLCLKIGTHGISEEVIPNPELGLHFSEVHFRSVALMKRVRYCPEWFVSDTAHIVFIHIPSVARNRVSRGYLMAELCFHLSIYLSIYIYIYLPIYIYLSICLYIYIVEF